MRITSRTRNFASLLLAASAAFAGVAQAQVYKTTDANGQVRYTDRAPSDAQQIRTPTPPKSPATPAAPRPAAPNPSTSNTAPVLPVSNSQSQQVQRDVALAREEQCKAARENYDKSVRAQRIYRVNDKGEREFLDPGAADAARLQAKAEMDSLCGS